LGGDSIFISKLKLQQPALSMGVGSNLAVNKGFYFRVSGDLNTMRTVFHFSKKGNI